jgi:hypothetical protein
MSDLNLHVIGEPISNVLLPTGKPGQWNHGANRSVTYEAWNRMQGQCRNPRHTNYHRYGAKGVTVAFRWLKFSSFLVDMGHAPPSTRLVRIDDSKGFEPGNCRWVPKQ